ncbi:DNA polymerase/3'-5' exonuclease PolX [Candidatus Woesearchaeota archaeon]|nr:DNA polymerase/3'-5' exonuclease PolX [Candidatus Woesearchaeota archaeon]
MKNQEVVEILNNIADILEIKKVEWKPIAYRKAARSIENLPKDIEDIYRKKGLDGITEVSGIGLGIGKKIAEYLDTGKIKEFDELKKTVPESVVSMMEIPGLGPKKVSKLYKILKINSLGELERAARFGKIRNLMGFGEKSEEDILMGIGLIKKGHERTLLGTVLPIANSIADGLRNLKEVSKIDIAGSIRRKKDTVKDIDILVISKYPEKVMNYFAKLNNIKAVLAKGPTKSSVVLKEGINCDLRVVGEKSYGGALAYFTGSKEHNIRMRQIAIKKGMKLSEYGLFDRKDKYICGKNEEELYSKLGLPYVEPEMREDTGELELKKMPKLIGYNEIKGDLHMHTTWSDGFNSAEDMVKAAIKKKYEYVAITDHSKSAHVANGMDEKRFKKYIEEIEKLKKKYKNEINILKGSEVDILKDGSLDYPNKILDKLDIVIASMHSGFRAGKNENTNRMIKAINSGKVNIIAHPTGRIINQRNPYEIDLNAVIKEAKENNVALEINSYPSRLDLNDTNIRLCIENDNKLVISTDSHSAKNLDFMIFGIAQARRGWAESKNIVNAMPFERFIKFIGKK